MDLKKLVVVFLITALTHSLFCFSTTGTTVKRGGGRRRQVLFKREAVGCAVDY